MRATAAGAVRDEAEDYAARMHARHECDAPATRLEEIALDLGYRVRWCTKAELAGPLGASLGRLILVARESTRARSIWTLAHEITHGELGEPHNAKDRALEERVDACVSSWLLPRQPFLHHVFNNGVHLGRLAQQFGTSMEATARRFLGIGKAALTIYALGERRGTWTNCGVLEVVHRTQQLAERAHISREHQEPVIEDGWIVGTWSTPGRAATYALAVPSHLVSPF